LTKYKRKKTFNRTNFENEIEENKNPEIEKSEIVLDKESNSTHQKLSTKPRIISGIKYAYIAGIAALVSGIFTPFTLGHELQTIVSGILVLFAGLLGGILIFKGIGHKKSYILSLGGMGLIIFSLILIYELAERSLFGG
jgi:hypothetical protein|tara:strand:+ start:1657 stop:2073 length:417 start_codon:yes stop_codon:yes gene_type:complete